MRHRNQVTQLKTSESAMSGALATLTGTLAPEQPMLGKHRAPVTTIPAQTPRDHKDPTVFDPEVAQTSVPQAPVALVPAPKAVPAPKGVAGFVAPETARWRASHLPRLFAAALLVLALVGTTALGIRFAGLRSSDNFVSLVIAIVVVVVLWAMLIASTPQEVTLRGPVLTVHNSGGYERFDLSDGLQPVDVVGDPRSSKWAVLLHRADGTTVVLRRHDVVAAELDPIVRHYKSVADQRFSDRASRFGR